MFSVAAKKFIKTKFFPHLLATKTARKTLRIAVGFAVFHPVALEQTKRTRVSRRHLICIKSLPPEQDYSQVRILATGIWVAEKARTSKRLRSLVRRSFVGVGIV